jgi:hypothetical protein
MALVDWDQVLEEVRAIAPDFSWRYEEESRESQFRRFHQILLGERGRRNVECRLFRKERQIYASDLYVDSGFRVPGQIWDGRPLREQLALLSDTLKTTGD